MPHPYDAGSGTSQVALSPVSTGLSFFGADHSCSAPSRSRFCGTPHSSYLTPEQSMNYVHDLFLLRGQIMVRAVVEEAATLTSLALFLGMIAIWAQVIATL